MDINACLELVLDFLEAIEHKHFKTRGMIAKVPDLDGLSHKQIASPFKFSRCRAEYLDVGAELGEQTQMVLNNLGYTEKQIEKLKINGVCADNKTR